MIPAVSVKQKAETGWCCQCGATGMVIHDPYITFMDLARLVFNSHPHCIKAALGMDVTLVLRPVTDKAEHERLMQGPPPEKTNET